MRQYHLDMFPRLPAPGQFNHRRRALCMITEQVRRVLLIQWELLPQGDTYRLTDSAPIPVCTYTRAKLNRTISQDRHLYFGYTPARKAKLFGFRLHLGTSTDGVVDNWLLAPASMHDSQVTGLYEGEEVAQSAGAGRWGVQQSRLQGCFALQAWPRPTGVGTAQKGLSQALASRVQAGSC